MGNYVQLDQAARTVGKSEVTLRRLIKAGKVSHKKEKTLTGFLYLLDPEEVQRFYGDAGSSAEVDLPEDDEDLGAQKTKQIRVAVANETGGLSEYWQKRAETYETRYQQIMETQAQLREELGVWRGRAEQAQNMLVKLLPAGESAADKEQAKHAEKKNQDTGSWIIAILGVIAGVLVVGIMAMLYLASR